MNKQYISGYGQLSNLGLGSEEALQKLLSPRDEDTLRLPKNHLDSEVYIESLASLPDVDHITTTTDYAFNRTNHMMILCIEEALKCAKIKPQQLPDLKVGVCIGTTSANLTCDLEFGKKFYKDEAEDFTPLIDSLKNNPSAAVASYYNLDGPITSINNACTSGTDAIGIACSWIKQGLCDVVIAGGIDSVLEDIYAGFRSLGLVSEESAKPFDKNRDGLALGEGVGITIIESQQSLANRKAQAFCEVLGYGIATDSHHPTSPHPDAKGLSLAVDQALNQAKLSKEQIDLINAHGTGTETNDRIEGNYLKSQFPNTPVFATKAYTGHTLGAAGTLEAIWGIFCMNHSFIPATLGHSEVDPDILLQPNLEVRDYKSKIYLSTSLGFGGSNAALLLGKVDG